MREAIVSPDARRPTRQRIDDNVLGFSKKDGITGGCAAMIRLTKADTFDSRTMEECFVNEQEIAAIVPCAVGERSTGSLITLKSGDTIRVWENPGQIHKRLRSE